MNCFIGFFCGFCFGKTGQKLAQILCRKSSNYLVFIIKG
jgi:hypothetical protein